MSAKRWCFARVTEVTWQFYAQSYSHHQFAEHESTKTCCRLVNLSVRRLCGYYEDGKSLAGALQAGTWRSGHVSEVSAFDLNPFGEALLTY